MSHELRTPHISILGFAQFLDADATPALNDRQQTAADHILKSCEYLLALIDDVLDLARIDSGRPGLSIEAIDPATALPRYLETIRGMAGEYNVVVDDQISGANVPKGLQAKLFDPFERLGKEASEISSTGIGLTVAKDLTDMMDINLPGMAGLRRQRTSRRTRIPGTFRSSPSPPPPCLPK